MTTLPERLRASADELCRLYLYSRNQTVKLIDSADAKRIARELEEAAGALEVQQKGTAGVLASDETKGASDGTK